MHNAVLDTKRTYGTVTEPITLAEAKDWCKVDTDITDDDTVITALITVARGQLEQYTCLSLVPVTIKARLRNELGGIYLPYGPVTGTVTIKDCEGETVATANVKLYGEDFPQLELPEANNITAEYAAGYTSGTIPAWAKLALKMQVAYLYENRGDSDKAKDFILSPDATQIAAQHRRVDIC